MAAAAKLERLLNLVALLLETPRPLTAEQIRTRMPNYPADREAFRRMFERDKEDLRERGVPIELEEVPGVDPPIEGYRIRKDRYYLRDPGLEPEELASLHLAASAVQLAGLEGASALWQLGGRVDEDVAARLPDVAALPAGPQLVDLATAVSERRPATFSYRGTERTVDPYRLDFARGHWYVTGFDHLRSEERNFRLDRIDGDVALGAPRSFTRPETDVPGVRLQPWLLGASPPVVATILIDADQAAVTETTLGSEAVVERRDDGSIVVTLEVTNVAGFRTFVLGFLEHAEVLAPPELRAAVVEWLTDLAAAP